MAFFSGPTSLQTTNHHCLTLSLDISHSANPLAQFQNSCAYTPRTALASVFVYASTSAVVYVRSDWRPLRISRSWSSMKSTKTRSTGSVSATPAGESVPMKSGTSKKGCETVK